MESKSRFTSIASDETPMTGKRAFNCLIKSLNGIRVAVASNALDKLQNFRVVDPSSPQSWDKSVDDYKTILELAFTIDPTINSHMTKIVASVESFTNGRPRSLKTRKAKGSAWAGT